MADLRSTQQLTLTSGVPVNDAVTGALTVEIRDSDAEIVVLLHGEADIATARVLSDGLASVCANGHHRVVLDLAAVEFMDAHSLGLIAQARRDLQSRHAELILCAPSKLVRRVLGIVGWDGSIEEPPSTPRLHSG